MAFPGVDGAAQLDMGKRPRVIVGRGTLETDTFAGMRDFATELGALDQIEGTMDGAAYTLVDTQGQEHANCVLMRFMPGPIMAQPNGKYTCDWQAVFSKLGG